MCSITRYINDIFFYSFNVDHISNWHYVVVWRRCRKQGRLYRVKLSQQFNKLTEATQTSPNGEPLVKFLQRWSTDPQIFRCNINPIKYSGDHKFGSYARGGTGDVYFVASRRVRYSTLVNKCGFVITACSNTFFRSTLFNNANIG